MLGGLCSVEAVYLEKTDDRMNNLWRPPTLKSDKSFFLRGNLNRVVEEEEAVKEGKAFQQLMTPLTHLQ